MKYEDMETYEIISELLSENERLREQNRKQKLFFKLKIKDIKARAEYEAERQVRGYCPKCYMLRNLNGKCDNCD